jgi:hypothetical protein
MINKSLLKTMVFLVGIIIVAFVVKSIVLGGKPVIGLSSAPALAGPISRSLGPFSQNSPILQPDKDYRIRSARYFDNKKWVVVNIVPVDNKINPAISVLKKINGVYQTILGPAGSFSYSYVYVLPPDVSQYLSQQGVLNGG